MSGSSHWVAHVGVWTWPGGGVGVGGGGSEVMTNVSFSEIHARTEKYSPVGEERCPNDSVWWELIAGPLPNNPCPFDSTSLHRRVGFISEHLPGRWRCFNSRRVGNPISTPLFPRRLTNISSVFRIQTFWNVITRAAAVCAERVERNECVDKTASRASLPPLSIFIRLGRPTLFSLMFYSSAA